MCFRGRLFFCFAGALLVLKVCCRPKEEEKLGSIKCRLRFPCSSETRDYQNCKKPVLFTKKTNSSFGEIATTTKATHCLHQASLLEAVKEALDIGTSLLENENISRWVTGKWAFTADKMTCDMKSCVQLKVPTKTDTNQTRLVSDMLKIVSFADYIRKASKYWNPPVQRDMKDFEKRMMNVACKIATGLSSSTHDYVVTTEDLSNVPSDLVAPKAKGPGRVATYIVLQKIEDFFKRLVDSYTRGRLICSSKKPIT